MILLCLDLWAGKGRRGGQRRGMEGRAEIVIRRFGRVSYLTAEGIQSDYISG